MLFFLLFHHLSFLLTSFLNYIVIITISMTIKLYIDYMSQPSRAAWALCIISKVKYEIKQVRVGKFQNNSEQYKMINPMGKLPAIEDTSNGFRLAESHAIMRYICSKYPEDIGNWYPQDNLIKRAKIDEYLDFHHTNTRKCAFLLFHTVFAKNMKLNPDSQFVQALAIKDVDQALNNFCKIYLAQSKYIAGDHPTIADLSAFYEIQMLMLRGQNFEKWPKLQEWLKRMGEIKQVNDANKVFKQILKRNQPNAKL